MPVFGIFYHIGRLDRRSKMDRRGDGAPERQVFQKAFIQHYDQVCGTGHHGNSLPTVNRLLDRLLAVVA